MDLEVRIEYVIIFEVIYCLLLLLEIEDLKFLGWSGKKSYQQIFDYYLDFFYMVYFLLQFLGIFYGL